MNIIGRIYSRASHDFHKFIHLQSARKILETPPIRIGEAKFVLASMVQRTDVIPYLVAVKSFCVSLNPERIIVICDPSLTEHNKNMIKSHVNHVEFFDATDFQTPIIPQGGTWERLCAITHFCEKNYVIQLDADTITSGPIIEVVESVERGSGFVIGERVGQKLMTLEQTSMKAQRYIGPNAHIQDIAEAAINDIGLPGQSRYVRGCSGFTGFPIDPEMKSKMLDFSSRMHNKLGNDWSRWGTEQITSNYLVANARGTSVLPYPKYCTPMLLQPNIEFMHFIGSVRFRNSNYTKATSKAIHKIARES
ncbi:MAG: hypothetical protein LBI87_08600 [Candidatus Accumulibacter sp.]|jgi:hypothetical protein|nr:hypothetical protein [Accumulibacter sp.]